MCITQLWRAGIVRPIRVVYESVCIRDVRDRRHMQVGRQIGATEQVGRQIGATERNKALVIPKGGKTSKVTKFPREVRSFSTLDRFTSSARARCLCTSTCTSLRSCSRAQRTHVTSIKTHRPPLQTTRDLQVAHRRYPKPVQTGRIVRSTIPPTRESNPIPTV